MFAAYRWAVETPKDDRLAAMRVEYGSVEKDGSSDLDVDWLADGWLALLHRWIADAEAAGIAEPNAMVLATIGTGSDSGRPVSRTVLCKKSVDETGITFYTNYDSAKGDELAATPYAAVTFPPWYALGRQVHIRGAVTKVSAQETEEYWSKTPTRIPAGGLGVCAVAPDRLPRRAARSARRGH